MSFKFSSLSLILGAIALPMAMTPMQPALTSPAILAQKPSQNEDISVNGNNGNYEVRLWVNSSPEKVWKVMTNYNDLSRFIPDLVSSKVVETKGNQKVIDQVFLANYTFGLKIKAKFQVTESHLKGLDIKLLKSDYIKSFQGNWNIKNKKSPKTLLTYNLKLDLNLPFGKELFYQPFEEQIVENMIRLKKEIESGS
ncbi:MAG: SRPBCC family protein [Microcystaceae cyanobacterium]